MHGKATRAVDAALMLAIALVTTALRLLSATDLSNDHYMHMAWAQQLLFGELPGRDFVDPGMPLTYVLSALVQLLSPGPFSETVFTAGMLGVAAALTYLAATRLSGSRLLGFAAAVIQVVMITRLYSYPKVLVPAVAVLLMTAYATRGSTRKLVLLGAWTTAAGLLRHDLGLYAAVGAGCMLLALHWGEWRTLVRASGIYAAATAITVAPYLLYLAWAEGIGEHLRRSQEFVRTDEHQRVILTPDWSPLSDGWSLNDSTVFLYYFAHVLLLALVMALIARRGVSRPVRATASGIAGMFAMYLLVVLRYPIDARLPDVASVFVLALTATYGVLAVRQSGQMQPLFARLLTVVTAVVVLTTGATAGELGHIADQVDGARFFKGYTPMRRRFVELERRGSVWPWTEAWPERALPPAIEYLDACTAPSDSLLVTWPAPHYSFFARRRFAAGHGLLLPPYAYTTEQDQQQMLTWLERQSVPIVLINDSRNEEFRRAYGRLEAYVREHYAPIGEFVIYDDSHITVAMKKGLTAEASWGPDHWPCPQPSAGVAAGAAAATSGVP